MKAPARREIGGALAEGQDPISSAHELFRDGTDDADPDLTQSPPPAAVPATTELFRQPPSRSEPQPVPPQADRDDPAMRRLRVPFAQEPQG